ncbi:MAG: hypothetical protein JNN01_25800 [Opitutaceae bacterium]|nr:hypothetical protein [Opitutaceae bacterium]
MSIKNEDVVSALKKYPLIFTCALVSAITMVAIYYRRDEMPVATAALDEKSSLSERLKLNIVNSAQLAEQRDALIAANAAVAARLIKASELAKNQQYFYRLEAETGTKYKDLKQLPPTPSIKGGSNAYVAVPYTLVVEGGYSQLLSFMRRLENGSPFCHVSSANLARETSDISNQLLVLNLSIELLGQP